MKNTIILFLLGIILSTLSACLVIENKHTALPPGSWRAVLELDPKMITPNKKGEPLPEKMNLKFEEVAGGELPFNFEVTYKNETDFYIEIINGEERILVEDIVYGRDRSTGDDTIRIDFPIYDAHFSGKFEEGVLAGDWVVRNKENYRIPFVARHGKDHRFTNLKKTPMTDLSGKWEVNFSLEDDPYPAIGSFKQNGNHLEGTFMTETGDYRFLEGTIQDNKMYLSCFDGSHAFLFEGKILNNDEIIGSFRSGKHYKTTWNAKRNPDASLPDPDSLTKIVDGQENFNFSFKNANGQLISLKDKQYQGKAKIIQILGTWCPNCRDETTFLVDYFKKNPNEKVEIIAIAFEKHRDQTKAFEAIKRYKEKFNMDYEILLGGSSSKKEASEKLPFLNQVISYPTLLFLDQNNQVQRIHTGFNGPATDVYETFKKDFEKTVQEITDFSS